MNKETKIAKGFMKDYKEDIVGFLNKDYPKTLGLKFICKTHKQTCQRWLEFLGTIRFIGFECESRCLLDKDDTLLCNDCERNKRIDNQIIDLKQAIKLYEEAGI